MERSASFIPSWAVLYKTVCCVGGDLLHEPIRVDIWIVIVARTAFDVLSEVQSRRHDDAITFFLVVQGRVKFLVLVPIVTHVLRRGVRAWFEGESIAVIEAIRFKAEAVVRELPHVVDVIPQKAWGASAVDQNQIMRKVVIPKGVSRAYLGRHKPSFFASVCESDTCGWRGVWRSRKGWLGHALDLNGDHLSTRARAAADSKPAGNTPKRAENTHTQTTRTITR